MTAISILALDPSSDRTGAACVAFDGRGVPLAVHTTEIAATATHKDALTARLARIRETRQALSAWLESLPGSPDLVAYEGAFLRGQAASQALPQAAGAYLSLSALAGLRVVEVAPASVKAAYGNTTRGKTNTRAEREAKRQELKRRAIVWANRTFPVALAEDADAQADALAVAVAAWRVWHRERAQTPPLFGPGSGTPGGRCPPVAKQAGKRTGA